MRPSLPLEPENLGRAALAALPGLLLIYLSFSAGGFFPGTPGIVGVVLILSLAARVLFSDRPFEGFSRGLSLIAGAMALYAMWILISGNWSHSESRALIEFNRALIYLVALILFGSVPRESARIRWMVRGLLLAMAIVCTIALTTRVLPEVWPTSPNLAPDRLSYPLTYWNALGVLAAIGAVFCFHSTSSRSEPRWIQISSAAAFPIFAGTLLFTFSRGAILAGAVGLLVYAIVGRPRALISGALAVIPTSAIVCLTAFRAEALSSEQPTSAAAISEGHDVALVVGLCVVATALLRAILCTLDRPLDRLYLAVSSNRRWALPVAGAITASILLGVAFGSRDYASSRVDEFVNGNQIGESSDVRTRLGESGSNGRIDQWRVALEDGFEGAKLTGTGAGTFGLTWDQHRPETLASLTVDDAHSLYVENLSELGLVGLVLLLIVLGGLVVGVARNLHGPPRTLYAAILAGMVAWLIHAGLDWDWEMSAVTLWLFALGGAAAARHSDHRRDTFLPPLGARAGIAFCLLILALIPGAIAVSQGRLDSAVGAFLEEGDCIRASAEARGATEVISARAEPLQLEGYCQARLGQTQDAVQTMEQAVERDPGNWLYHYSLAVVQAAAGVNPREAAADAYRLNPLETRTERLVEAVNSGGPEQWRKVARPLLAAPVF